MSEETKSSFLGRTSTLVTIGVGVVAIIGGLTALLARDKGPSAEERYRAELRQEFCLGDLAAAARSSNWQAYAQGPGGRIDKEAWLTSMQTAGAHLDAGLENLEDLPPPAGLHDRWDKGVTVWKAYIQFWNDWRTHTRTLPSDRLTVFNYPAPEWIARLGAAQGSFETELSALMGGRCDVGSTNPPPP